MKLVKHVLQYVFEILDLGLKLNKKADTLDEVVEYTDSDFV